LLGHAHVEEPVGEAFCERLYDTESEIPHDEVDALVLLSKVE
jgi:hypothetical protein